jgi:protein tyrosine phosphatase (PTP) superfamily phosphohydrolase (DUF442 family)
VEYVPGDTRLGSNELMPDTLLKFPLLFLLLLLLGHGVRQPNGSGGEVSNDENDPPQDVVETISCKVYLPNDGPSERDYSELRNLMQITKTIYSGGEPKTEAAFQQLADLGVRMIVSVDGAKPKIELAEKYGLRYVHIPIGYDGIDEEAARSFARVADELEQTTYVHCHHGKHRGPAGAAVICIENGDVDGKRALEILEKAGTSREYAGLWKDVANYQRPDSGEEPPPLVSVADVGSLAAAMAQIDRAWDNLKLCEAAGWQTPSLHPDISPAREALLLKEAFHEMIRQKGETGYPDNQLFEWMKQSEQFAVELEQGLRAGNRQTVKSTFDAIQAQCKQCHAEYRN